MPDVRWNWARSVRVDPHRIAEPRTFDEVVTVVRDSIRLGRKVHPVGSMWSFSEVVDAHDTLLTLAHLDQILMLARGADTWVFPGSAAHGGRAQVLQRALREDVAAAGTPLVHVLAGCRIQDLYIALEYPRQDLPPREPWSLPTMGGSSGQTIAGAIGTGSHGGDFRMRPIGDMWVRAFHLIGADGREHWIERPGPLGVTDRARLARVLPGAELHYDDTTFDAALVALGSLGIVFSVVLGVRRSYGLSQSVGVTRWLNVANAIRDRSLFGEWPPPRITWEGGAPRDHFAAGGQPVRELPRHVEVLINPYPFALDPGDAARSAIFGGVVGPGIPRGRTCYVVSRVEGIVDSPPHPPPSFADLDQQGIGWDLEVNHNPAAFRSRIDQILSRARTPTAGFSLASTVMDGGGAPFPGNSMEIAIPMDGDRHLRFIEALLATSDELIANGHRLAGFYSLRFTMPSAGLLAMQHEQTPPYVGTCHLEVFTLAALHLSNGAVRGQPSWPWQFTPQWIRSEYDRATATYRPVLEASGLIHLQRYEALAHEHGGRLHWGQLAVLPGGDPRWGHDARRYPALPRFQAVRRALCPDSRIRTFDGPLAARAGIVEGSPGGWVTVRGLLPKFPADGELRSTAPAARVPPTLTLNPHRGWLELYAVEADGALSWNHQDRPNGSWVGWRILAPAPPVTRCEGRVAVCRSAAVTFAIVRARDGRLLGVRNIGHEPEWNETAPWMRLSRDTFMSNPSAAAGLDGRGVVVARRADGVLMWGRLAAPPDLHVAALQPMPAVPGGSSVYEPHVFTRGAEAAVVVRAADRRVWMTSQTATGWTDWERVGDWAAFSDPAAAASGDAVVVVAMGNDGRPWFTVLRGGAATPWAHVGMTGFYLDQESRIALAVVPAGVMMATRSIARSALEVAEKVQLMRWRAADNWSSFRDLGGPVASDPAIAVNQDGRLEVATRASHDLVQLQFERDAGEWVPPLSTLVPHVVDPVPLVTGVVVPPIKRG